MREYKEISRNLVHKFRVAVSIKEVINQAHALLVGEIRHLVWILWSFLI